MNKNIQSCLIHVVMALTVLTHNTEQLTQYLQLRHIPAVVQETYKQLFVTWTGINWGTKATLFRDGTPEKFSNKSPNRSLRFTAVIFIMAYRYARFLWQSLLYHVQISISPHDLLSPITLSGYL